MLAPRTRPPENADAEEPGAALLQNGTTRLSSRSSELLAEAALRQRLQQAKPATRQTMIKAAVRERRRQHG